MKLSCKCKLNEKSVQPMESICSIVLTVQARNVSIQPHIATQVNPGMLRSAIITLGLD